MIIDETDLIVDAAKLMRVSKISGTPVLDAKGELVGVISRTGNAIAIIYILSI